MTRGPRKKSERWALPLLVLSGLAFGRDAAADPSRDGEPATAWGSNRALLQRFGIDVARRLVRGGDAVDAASAHAEVLRGIDRSVALGTDDGSLVLVQLLQDPRSLARTDAIVLLAATRALAPFAGKRNVGRVLTDVVLNAPVGRSAAPARGGGDDPSSGLHVRDGEHRARLELARDTAALALARGGDEQAIVALVGAAQRGGPGQAAALRALAAFPPIALASPAIVTPEGIALSVALDDLRAEDGVLEASRSTDRATRLAGIHGLGALGDRRGLQVLVAAADDVDPLVREAAARSLVDLGAKDAAHAVRKLIEDDLTAAAGIALSSRVSGEEVVGALAARVRASSELTLRRDSIIALGRQDNPRALVALGELLTDPVLDGDAAESIARSRAPGAWDAIGRALLQPTLRRHGARMAALRGRVSGDAPVAVRHTLRDLSRASNAADRAVALAALVLVGEMSPLAGLSDPDPRVRRAVAMASDGSDAAHARAIGAHLATERDPLTRALLAGALIAARTASALTTTELLEHIDAGDIAAPLATLALTRDADEPERGRTLGWLGSPSPIARAHTALGLGEGTQPWAIGLLADRYEQEVDAGTRRMIVLALALRSGDAAVPLRAHVLERAAFFDPEESIRTLALRARMGLPPPELSSSRDAVWLHVRAVDGAPPSTTVSGLVLRPDGVAVPAVFDDDGYALIPAPPGPSRLVLAPRVHSYEALRHAAE